MPKALSKNLRLYCFINAEETKELENYNLRYIIHDGIQYFQSVNCPCF